MPGFLRLIRVLLGIALPILIFVGCSGAGETNGDDPPAPSAGAEAGVAFSSEPAPIVVDGAGDDWSGLPVRHDDTGDGGDPLGLERVWVAHSDASLFLRLTTDRPINLEENNDLTLYLDTDNDPSTGTEALGLGAEVAWTFGEREGTANGTSIEHEGLGIASLPTVRSDTFEIALDRSARPGGAPLFSGDSLRVALSSGGDRLPDGDGGLGYVLSGHPDPVDTPSLDRPAEADLRLVSYNIPNNFDQGENSLFEPERQPSYERILKAIDADVIGFQEMYDDSADEIEQVVEEDLGAVPASWEWAKTAGELVLGSPFAIDDTTSIPGADPASSGAYLLDTGDAVGERLLVVLMHPACCNAPEDNPQRQETVDGVVAFLRDVKRGESTLDVPENTPIVVMGDMNFVGDPQQPRTLRTGAIVNTDRFGEGVRPDWDSSPLLDTRPRQTGAPLHATTFNPESSFPPGRLDYAYVTDSVLDVVHEFVLSTPALSQAQHDAFTLEADDTTIGSDHLPVVIDVALR